MYENLFKSIQVTQNFITKSHPWGLNLFQQKSWMFDTYFEKK